MDRSCLKELGITSMGKQLQILSLIKDLLGTFSGTYVQFIPCVFTRASVMPVGSQNPCICIKELKHVIGLLCNATSVPTLGILCSR